MSNSKQWVETVFELQGIILDCIQVRNALKLADKKQRRKLLKRRSMLYDDLLEHSKTLESLKGHTAQWAINHWTRKLS